MLLNIFALFLSYKKVARTVDYSKYCIYAYVYPNAQTDSYACTLEVYFKSIVNTK